MARSDKGRTHEPALVAGNGLLDRRMLLGRGIVFASAAATGVGSLTSAAADPLPVDSWSMTPGAPIPAYGQPSKYENKVVRSLTNPNHEPRTSQARTPHHLLQGTITPAPLHFVVARTGIPDIDPAKHRLAIHGLVKQPLVFDLDALARYPMVSRTHFVECGGNSAPLFTVKTRCRGMFRPSMGSLLLRIYRREAFDPVGRSRHRSEGEVAGRRRSVVCGVQCAVCGVRCAVAHAS